MATYTPNYGLHQWVPEDQFLRTDFNEDFKKIDTALGQKADQSSMSSSVSSIQNSMNSQFSSVNSAINSLKGRLEVRVGTYTGNGASNRTISLGVTPEAVLVESHHGKRDGSGSGAYGGMATRSVTCGSGDSLTVEVVSGGFRVFQKQGYAETNSNGTVYRYLAFC